eukprot:TRINITY_DN803_c2_g1_i1.p1 TRINITY_DN803_c2_g1~~TRINITY_DN803_c2_g1_i1.p1  ORF type:complete len:179 (+),score=45.72 TRINITY_DN803_c2_g1_i1:57-539(+)
MGKHPREELEEEEEEEEEEEDNSTCCTVKISNCSDDFDDEALKRMIGAEAWTHIKKDGVTWAVSKEGLKFAGFGWVEFDDPKYAIHATQFGVTGTKAKEGVKCNAGNDLFIGLHKDDIPGGVCGWCGTNGHFARECHQRERGTHISKRPNFYDTRKRPKW